VCNGNTGFHTDMSQTCLGALFIGDVEQARKLCPIRTVNQDWAAEATGNNKVALFFREETSLQIRCPGTPRQLLTWRGSRLLPITADCTITGGDLSLMTGNDELIEEPLVLQPDWEPEQLLLGESPTSLVDLQHRLIGERRHVPDDIAELVDLGAEAEDRDNLQADEQDHGRQHTKLQVLAVTALTIGGAGVVFWICRYLYLCMGGGLQAKNVGL
jgi:hypothetical protein